METQTETTRVLQLTPLLLTETIRKSGTRGRPHHIASSLEPPAPSVFWVQLTIRLVVLMAYNNISQRVLTCCAWRGQAARAPSPCSSLSHAFTWLKLNISIGRECIQSPRNPPSRMNTPTGNSASLRREDHSPVPPRPGRCHQLRRRPPPCRLLRIISFSICNKKSGIAY